MSLDDGDKRWLTSEFGVLTASVGAVAARLEVLADVVGRLTTGHGRLEERVDRLDKDIGAVAQRVRDNAGVIAKEKEQSAVFRNDTKLKLLAIAAGAGAGGGAGMSLAARSVLGS